MRMGIASGHGGFASKNEIAAKSRSSGREVFDSGAHALDLADTTFPISSLLWPERSPRARSSVVWRSLAAASAPASQPTRFLHPRWADP